jgi:hypothetical protein
MACALRISTPDTRPEPKTVNNVHSAAGKGRNMSESSRSDEFHWKSPVRVRVGYGFPEIIRGPREALDYLTCRWPVRDGTYYLQALKDCAAFLQRQAHLESVRETFILASIEARMLG